MKKRTLSNLVAGVLLMGFCCFVPGAGFAADMPKMKMTIGHTGSDASLNQYLSLQLQELLQKKSNGNITVEIYPAGQIGSDKDMILSAKNGDITFHIASTGPLVNDVPAAAIIDIPFLFKDVQSARKTVNNPEFRKLFDAAFEKEGYKLMMLSDQGFRTLSTNKKIDGIESLKGMKIRTMENKNHIAFWKDLGVNATPMNVAEVYMSLQQGVIDGQENPYNIIFDNKYYEVQKYATNSNHIYHCMTVTMGTGLYDNLPDAYKTLLSEVMAEASQLTYAESDKTSSEFLKRLTDRGMEFINFDSFPNMREELRKRTGESVNRVKAMLKNDALLEIYLKAVGEN